MSKKYWFVVVGVGGAEVGGPLEGEQVVHFEMSGLSLRWKTDEKHGKLALWDARSNEISVDAPAGWLPDDRFQLPGVKVTDSDDESWVILIASNQAEAEAIDVDDDVLKGWLSGQSEYGGYGDDNN